MLIDILERNKIIPMHDSIIVGARHSSCIGKARDHLAIAKSNLQRGDSAEFIASELKQALESIGEIVGKTDNNAILDNLFNTFCIGK